MALPPLGRWVYPILAVLFLSTWSSGTNNEPMEFTVKVFPVTEEPVSASIEPELSQDEPEVTSVMADQSTTTTATTPPTTTTIPITTTTKSTTTETTTTSTKPPAETTTQTTTTTATSATTTTTTEATATTKPTTETTITTTLPTTTTTENPGHCPKDLYCDGELFPLEFYVAGHKVSCDHHPRVPENCCLPHGRHLVCYNITVDGEYLNYDGDGPSQSTDYMELCDVMVLSQNATAGPYSTISKKKGGGRMAYRYNEWAWVTPAAYRVKDLACMIQDPPQDQRKDKEGKKDSKAQGKKDSKGARENSTAQDEENELDTNADD